MLDLVPAYTLGHPGFYTVYDVANPTHRGLEVHSFIVDTGASCTVVHLTSAGLLSRPGYVPGIPIRGVGGDLLKPAGSGFLNIVFPGFPPPAHGFSSRGAVLLQFDPDGPSLMQEWQEPAPVLFARTEARPSSGPLIRNAADFARRFNQFKTDVLRDVHKYVDGVADLAPSPGADYTAGLASSLSTGPRPSTTP